MKWFYEQNCSHKRDERIDYIRGAVMTILIVVHIDIFSIYNYIAWERLGVISGAEGFVLLSGVVLGIVNRTRILHDGWHKASVHLVDRSLQLYRISLFVIVSVPILHTLPYIDATVTMTFKDGLSKILYQLYPLWSWDFNTILANILLLKHAPHQFQVLGLYIVLLLVAPFALWLIEHKRFKLLLALSWFFYIVNSGYHLRPTGAQFEYAFPVLSWQLLFVHGLVLGYYKEEVWKFFHTQIGKILFGFLVLLFLLFLFFTYNNPMPQIPVWLKLSIIPPETFYKYYNMFFMKNTLGYGRIINDFVMLIVSYALLSYFWKPIHRLFGWFFIPIGKSSLYIFIWHIYFCILIANLSIFEQNDIFINTLGHTFVLIALWILVKKRVLFSIIPR